MEFTASVIAIWVLSILYGLCSIYSIDTDWRYLVRHWVPDHIRDMGLDIDPDFQRPHVWTQDKQVAYIEFCLRGGGSARDLYFNCIGWNKSITRDFVLVDGKQRLQAIMLFMNNQIKAFGYYFNEFKDKMDHTFASCKVHVNDLDTRKEVLQWYLDINMGGVVHTDDEIDKVKELLKKEI